MYSTVLLLSIVQALGAYAAFQGGIAPRAPQLAVTSAGSPACSSVENAISFCSSAIPGFATADNEDLANCFCYDGSSWVPDAFDGIVYTCAQFAATALPATAYSNIASLEGFCSVLGPIDGGGPASASATTTPAGPATTAPPAGSVDIFADPACSTVGAALDYCNSISPGFSTMDLTSQAPCLCYDSTSWLPNRFDGAILTCAEYVSSAAPSSLSIVAGLEGFCSSIGNVLAGGAGAGATATGRVTNIAPATTPEQTITQPAATPTVPTPVATTVQGVTTMSNLAAAGMESSFGSFGLFAVGLAAMILV